MAMIFGTERADSLRGTAEADQVYAYGGDDSIVTFGPATGGGGFDIYRASIDDAGDIVYAAGGNDYISTGAGADRVFAWYGADTIIGGSGLDELHGGPGRDTFVFQPLGGPFIELDTTAGGRDVVADFQPGRDLLDFSGYASRTDGAMWVGSGAFGGTDVRATQIGYRFEGENTVVEFRIAQPSPAIPASYGGSLPYLTGQVLLSGRFELSRGDVLIEAADRDRPPAPFEFADEYQAQATRLYDTVFDRPADREGLDFWTSTLRQGYSLDAIADLFMTAPEFRELYGTPVNDFFVDRLYRNVLDRGGEREGQAFWTAALDEGRADRSDIVVAFSESAEHRAKVTADEFLP